MTRTPDENEADEESDLRVDRRTFIKGAGIIAGSAALPVGSASASPTEHISDGTLSPYIHACATWTGFEPYADIKTYGSDGLPGWLFGYEDDETSTITS